MNYFSKMKLARYTSNEFFLCDLFSEMLDQFCESL